MKQVKQKQIQPRFDLVRRSHNTWKSENVKFVKKKKVFYINSKAYLYYIFELI